MNGLDWRKIYWVRGKTPKGASYLNHVTDPPCSGWQHAVIVCGEKRSTIFCPYTLTSYPVPNDAHEIEQSADPSYPLEERKDFVVALILKKWDEHQRRGQQSDYDTAALVLKRLDAEVPTITLDRDGNEDKKSRGGKPVGDSLKKPVNRTSKRGKFLQWFLDESSGTRSVRETMAEFGMTRSNALSYLHAINRDHGIGYGLVGDAATITLPEGCRNPYEEQDETAEDEDDDSWLD